MPKAMWVFFLFILLCIFLGLRIEPFSPYLLIQILTFQLLYNLRISTVSTGNSPLRAWATCKKMTIFNLIHLVLVKQYHSSGFILYIVPENIHSTLSMEGIFSKISPPLWKFQQSFLHFLNLFSLLEPLTPQEIPIPSVGGVHVRIFSGTAHNSANEGVLCVVMCSFASF